MAGDAAVVRAPDRRGGDARLSGNRRKLGDGEVDRRVGEAERRVDRENGGARPAASRHGVAVDLAGPQHVEIARQARKTMPFEPIGLGRDERLRHRARIRGRGAAALEGFGHAVLERGEREDHLRHDVLFSSTA